MTALLSESFAQRVSWIDGALRAVRRQGHDYTRKSLDAAMARYQRALRYLAWRTAR